jgi:CSLREA domain-containing protein
LGSPAAAQIVVTSTADIPVDQANCVTAGSDSCTLRAAIDRLDRVGANPRRITFNLSGPGPHVIRLEPTLGPLNWTSSGEIDGLSQPGAGRRFGSDPENPVDYVLQVGIAAPLFQTLNGPLMVISGDGTLRGIAFFDHDGVGVRLQRGNISQSFFNTLNGTDPGPRTLTTGVEYRATNTGSSEAVSRSLFMGPGRGVELIDARTSGARAIAQPFITESYFGTDRTGLLSRPLEYGVVAQITTAPPVFSGGPRPVEALIRGSLFFRAERNAIRLRGTRPYLEDNIIGYDAAGARITGTPPVTQGAGILIEGPNYPQDGIGGRIGYVKIYGQRGPGIQLDDTHGSITNFEIIPAVSNARSSIFGNGGLGISLNPAAPATPTPNDAGDGDTGPNGRQNHPVIESMQRALDGLGDERLTVRLRLESRPNRAYRLQFFTSSACDPSGYGEGEVVLASEFDENGGELLTDANGLFSGTVTLGGQGINTLLDRLDGRPFVTVLATDASDSTTGEGGNTSEFSPCYDARSLDPPGQQLGFEQREYTFREGQTASVLVRRTGGTTGEVRVLFETADGSALAGRDYTTVRRDLVFADGINGFGVQIPLRANDTTPQPTREFVARLLVPTGGTGGATIDPFRAEATIRIEDDDVSYEVRDSVGSEVDGQMNFGAVEYGGSAEGSVTIRNTGEPRLTFESIEFARTPADDRFREVGRTCGQFLDQDQSCTVTVRFEPGDLNDTPPAVPVVGQGQILIVPRAGPSRSVTVAAVAPPRASLFLSFDEVEPINPEPGGSVQFRIIAYNGGPASADSSVVTIGLPPGLALAADTLTPSQGIVSSDASSVTWEVGPLVPVTTDPATRATLTWLARVDATITSGSQLTVDAALQLTDPRRVDPSPTNAASATLSIGTAAANLWLGEMRISNTTIAIARRCTKGRDLCRDDQWFIDTAVLTIPIRNDGPDIPTAPVDLRITMSGLCFQSEIQWIDDPKGGFKATCSHGSVVSLSIDPLDLQPGQTLVWARRFFAPSGPTGPATIEAEIVHATFDPFPADNSALSPPIQVTVPLSANVFDGNEWCFIATAAYGSWLDPHVATLRAFRDRWLLPSAPGRAFVAWYYRVSPPLADWIATREWARATARGALAPVVFTIEYPGLAGGIAIAALSGLWGIRTRRRRPAEVTP